MLSSRSLVFRAHVPPRVRLLSVFAIVNLFLVRADAAPPINPDLLPPAQRNVVVAKAVSAPEPTNEVLVFLEPGTDVAAFAQSYNLRIGYALQSDPQAFVFATSSPAVARWAEAAANRDARARRAYVNEVPRYELDAFVPNDPYFLPVASYSGQWHLANQFVPGRDVRAQGAWNRDVTGAGVLIGVLDEGMETTHPDLAPNYVADDSYDFSANDPFPEPVGGESHSTSVAGVAAARGGNGIGVTGVAPFASLAALRVFGTGSTTAKFADATLYHSSGANTNIKIKNHSYGYSSPFIADTLGKDTMETSALAGTLHALSAGNARIDTNKRDRGASWAAINVAALGSNGRFASYSNYGACVAVTAPSSGSSFGITTTDRLGTAGYNGFVDANYTSTFGGTSSASPLAGGVLALGKQIRPDMDVRMAKHLLAITSDVVDPTDATPESDGGWRTNAAGTLFNQNYGFGLVDANDFTLAAARYCGVTPLQTETTGSIGVGAALPDNNLSGVSRSFSLAATTRLEEVQVALSISHTRRGNVEAYLTSPSGTTSRLFIRSSSDTGANINWTFTSNVFWGENPQGEWTLTLRDVFAGTTGTWNSFQVSTRMGQLIRCLPRPQDQISVE